MTHRAIADTPTAVFTTLKNMQMLGEVAQVLANDIDVSNTVYIALQDVADAIDTALAIAAENEEYLLHEEAEEEEEEAAAQGVAQ